MFYYIYSIPKHIITQSVKPYRLEVLTFMHGKIAKFHTEKNHEK